jgi:hypothetical protein
MRKFETNIPRKEIARPRSQFPHSCICERFIYLHDRPTYFAAAKYGIPAPYPLFHLPSLWICTRGGHRHLQIGRMLNIDPISEPPTAPPPRCMYIKFGNLCGQRGRKRFIASWGLRMSHICPCTPCPSPQVERSKVESRHFVHH